MHATIVATTIAATFAVIASPALAIDFPLRANDMAPDERVFTSVHAPGGGPQTNAKDLLIFRHIADNNWSRLKAGQTDESINSNYLVYGRPVHAMAGGTVIACWRNAPEGSGHTKHPQRATGKIYLQGNHLWIKQADGNIALYAHAITGDIPASLCPKTGILLTGTAGGGPVFNDPESVVTNGATVTAGQLLFHAGNSGNSSEPHLHVHIVNASNTTQTMKFDRGQTQPFGSNVASLRGPWTRLKGAAVPMASIFVWAPHQVGNWTYNGIPAVDYQSIFDHFVDSGEMPDTVSCHNNGATYDSNWIPTHGAWVSNHGMSIADHALKNATLMAQGFKETAVFTCGSIMAAVWRKP